MVSSLYFNLKFRCFTYTIWLAQGKHSKKQKKHKSKRHSKASSSSEEEWVEADSVVKSPDPEKKKRYKRRHSSGSESSDSQNLNKKVEKREDWMSLPTTFTSVSTQDSNKLKQLEKKLQKEQDQYDPRKNSRELNKYWKDGGDGLPKFQKPREDDDRKERSYRYVTNSLKKPFYCHFTLYADTQAGHITQNGESLTQNDPVKNYQYHQAQKCQCRTNL